MAESIDQALKEIELLLRRDPDPADQLATLPELRDRLIHMQRDGSGRGDPIREVFARLGDKWSTLLLLLLNSRGYRHATLFRLVGVVAAEGQISQRILRLRMRTLERDGLVQRTVVDLNPPGVLYQLTGTGRELVQHAERLIEWARRHNEEIRDSQMRFDLERKAELVGRKGEGQ